MAQSGGGVWGGGGGEGGVKEGGKGAPLCAMTLSNVWANGQMRRRQGKSIICETCHCQGGPVNDKEGVHDLFIGIF